MLKTPVGSYGLIWALMDSYGLFLIQMPIYLFHLGLGTTIVLKSHGLLWAHMDSYGLICVNWYIHINIIFPRKYKCIKLWWTLMGSYGLQWTLLDRNAYMFISFWFKNNLCFKLTWTLMGSYGLLWTHLYKGIYTYDYFFILKVWVYLTPMDLYGLIWTPMDSSV